MHSTYQVIKGSAFLGDLTAIPGIQGVYPNPHGAGANVVEIVHERDPERLPLVVKDQTIGTVILKGPLSSSEACDAKAQKENNELLKAAADWSGQHRISTLTIEFEDGVQAQLWMEGGKLQTADITPTKQ